MSLTRTFTKAYGKLDVKDLKQANRSYKNLTYHHEEDEIAKLLYLISKNLKNLWILVERHGQDIPANEINLENDFFNIAPINHLFEQIADRPEVESSGAVKDAVACYTQFIDVELEDLNDKSLQALALDATRPLKSKVVGQLFRGTVLDGWNTNAIPALRLAVLRLNHINGGPLHIEGDTDLDALWDLDNDVEQDENREHEETADDDMPQHGTADQILLGVDKNNKASMMTPGGDEVDTTGFPALQGRNVTLAYDYVFHPFPENRANEVAQSRLIERDLREPGVQSEGLLPEDCVNLPPSHCRPPGMYTGHKRRDPRGPYEVFKALTSEMIQCIVQRPRRGRTLPATRPAVTSRAACRSRKIMKDALRRQDVTLRHRRSSRFKVQKSRPVTLRRSPELAQKHTHVPRSSSKRYGSSTFTPTTVSGGASKSRERPLLKEVGNSPPESHKNQEVHAEKEGEETGTNRQENQSKDQASSTNGDVLPGIENSTQSQPDIDNSVAPNGESTLHPRDYDAYDAQDLAEGKADNVSAEVRQKFKTWQASFPDEEVGPEPTHFMQECGAGQVSNDRVDAGTQLQEDLNRAANDNVEEAETEEAETEEAETEEAGLRKSPEQPKTSPPQISKASKTKKTSRTADRELRDLAQDLSPKNINKRTRAQRRNNQAEMEYQNHSDDDDSDVGHRKKKIKRQDKGKDDDKSKNKKRKTPKNTGSAKDKAYKPQKDDDSEDSDDHNLDGGTALARNGQKRAAGAGQKTTRATGQKQEAKGKQKAQRPAPPNTRVTKKKDSKVLNPSKNASKRARKDEEEEEVEAECDIQNLPKWVKSPLEQQQKKASKYLPITPAELRRRIKNSLSQYELSEEELEEKS